MALYDCPGRRYATKIDGAMDAALYVDILEDELLQTMDFYGLNRSDVILQQDNDPKHTSHLAINWLLDNSINVLDWPGQSPDLNAIEHLWCHLKRQLAAYESAPQSVHELWERVQTQWDKIAAQSCIDLIESMARRVGAVLKARGGHTKYWIKLFR